VAGPTKTFHSARIAFWAAMLCSWLVQALAARHTLDADGVSYLNIANAGLQGNWHAFVNGYWIPLSPDRMVQVAAAKSVSRTARRANAGGCHAGRCASKF